MRVLNSSEVEEITGGKIAPWGAVEAGAFGGAIGGFLSGARLGAFGGLGGALFGGAIGASVSVIRYYFMR